MEIHHWVGMVVVLVLGYYLHKLYPGILPGS